jgi:hypothetical protein
MDQMVLQNGTRSSGGGSSSLTPSLSSSSSSTSSSVPIGAAARLSSSSSHSHQPSSDPCRTKQQEVDDNNADAATAAISPSIFSGSYCPSVGANTARTTSQTTVGTRATAATDRENGGVRHNHVSGITDSALQHFYDAMALLDPETKEAYAKAQARCSQAVWRHECCPCYFVRACRFNPWDAAVRMCAYWKERIRVFGEEEDDRAFEAMTLGTESVPPTGLTEGDVKLFETGTFQVLPKDGTGRTVLFVDEAELEPGMLDQPASRLRVLWYVLHASCLAGGGENAHRLVVLCACYRPPSGGQYSASTLQFSAGAVKCPQVLPIAVDSIHLLTLQPKTGTGALINIILAGAAAMLGSYLSSLTHVHHGTTRRRRPYVNALEEETHAKQVLLWKLLDVGFTGKGLPYWAGGFFEFHDFVAWARRRRRFEQKAFWNADQRTQQRRNVNRAHSRKKRKRRHEELGDLHEQASTLRRENERAKSVHAHLEQLVAGAIETVAQAHAGPPQAARIATGNMTRPATDGPESSLDQFLQHPRLPNALEPDPIAPTRMASIAASTSGPHGSLFSDPSNTLQFSGGVKLPFDQGPFVSGGTADRTFHDAAFAEGFRPAQPPLEFENAPSDCAWNCQSSVSSTPRESTTTQPSELGLCRTPPVLLDGTVSAPAGVALPSSLSECDNFCSPGAAPTSDAPADGLARPRPDRAGPTGTNHSTAHLLRAMLQHLHHHQPQSHAVSEANTMPSERVQGVCHVGALDPDGHRVPFRPQAQSRSWQLLLPSPAAGGETGSRAEVWTGNVSVGDGSGSWNNRSVTDDGRVDVSMLFDLDWP